MTDPNDVSRLPAGPPPYFAPPSSQGNYGMVSQSPRTSTTVTSSLTSSWNTNAIPFHPSSLYQQNVPAYADAPMYENYEPPFQYPTYQFGQPPLQFTTYMENVDGEGAGGIPYDGALDAAIAGGGQQFILSPDLCKRMIYSPNAALLQEVQVGLEQLIYEPEEFETWSGAIRDRLVVVARSFGDADRTSCDDSLQIVVDMIFQMATLTPGVQYNFSRLCALLCKEVSDFQMKFLLPMLRKFHETQRSMMSPEQLYNLLLFFAELYVKLETEQKERLHVIGIAVREQMTDILNLPKLNDSSVKSVIQVLKLSGRLLESDFPEGVSTLDQLFTRLNAIAMGHPGICESVKQQIKSLSALRTSNWGMNSHEASSKGTAQGEQSDATLTASTSSGFIIGPDGQPLSEEEKAFLEENFGRLDNSDANDSTVESAIEDSDAADDYEEFLSEMASLPASEGNHALTSVETDLSKLALKENSSNTTDEQKDPNSN